MIQQGGKEDKELSFEDILEKYQKMIHHLIHKYNIRDPQGEFFQEGMIALWNAYERYGDRETFGKMAYITIRSRLIDLIRKKNRLSDNETATDLITETPTHDPFIEQYDPFFWEKIRGALTEKQWLFVKRKIIEGRTYQDIAALEGTTVDSVKGWGKEVKRKLKPVLADDMHF